MHCKQLSLSAVITIGILLINGAGNAVALTPESGIQPLKGVNLLCDMGPTGYAVKIPHKHVKKHILKKITCRPKPVITGAACPTQSPAPCEPCVQPCQPVNPCPEPSNPCPTGAASQIVQPVIPIPAPCEPVNPCPAPCNPCNQ